MSEKSSRAAANLQNPPWTAAAPDANAPAAGSPEPGEAGAPSPRANAPVGPGPLASPARASRTGDLLLDVPLTVAVEIGRVSLPIRQVMALEPGLVVELDRLASDPADVYANGKKIAQGEVVVVGDTLGIRITHLITAERLPI
ncbi:MAG: flagellar motor switch protein FliN [Armatimonadetes bacterium]|nr:flagellar motor switch protein FliN [Armatimonadota bacterium]